MKPTLLQYPQRYTIIKIQAYPPRYRGYVYDWENEELQQGVSGGKRIVTGAVNICSGFAAILVPVPTAAEDVIGVRKIIWGVVNVCYGIAEVISASWG